MGEDSFLTRLRVVLTNKNYIFVTLAITSLYYVITGIQYWASDYMKKTLNQEAWLVDIIFPILSISSPVTGVIIGGTITAKLGGYSTKRAIKQTVLFGLFACLSALPIPFVQPSQFWLFIAFLWLLMFFGGSILPSMTGIMLNTVKNEYKTVANSMAYLIFNCLGYLPAPVVYGLISHSGTGDNARLAMFFLMYVSLFTVVCLLLAVYFIFKEDALGWKKQETEIKKKPIK